MSRPLATLLLAVLAATATTVTTVSAATASPPPPEILSISVAPKIVPSTGGKVIVRIKATGVRTCSFSNGRGRFTERCADGVAAAEYTIGATTFGARQAIQGWVQVAGPGGSSAKHQITIYQAGAPTTCSSPCTFTFPSFNEGGLTSIRLGGVAQAVVWPGKAADNDVTSGDQLDVLNLTICAGSTGANTSGAPLRALALNLSDSGQGVADANALNDSTAPFDNAISVGAGQCLAAADYFDVPIGVSWTSVSFTYSSGDPRIVYTWNNAPLLGLFAA